MSIVHELVRAAQSLPTRSIAMRVSEAEQGQVTLTLAWVSKLEYKSFEVVLSSDGRIDELALARALKEVK